MINAYAISDCVETTLFQRQAEAIWDDEEREQFIDFIALHPEQGDIIPETGGIRKVRWSRVDGGKRGGARIIYFYHDGAQPLYLLMVYAKARQENMTPEQKRAVRKFSADLKSGAS